MKPTLDPELWSLLRLALHAGFLLATANLLRLAFKLQDPARLRHLARPQGRFRLPMILLTLLFLGLLTYQATWQLTGTLRPQFIGFMQLHDRREFNPAHRIRRGRILDRRGEALAYSEEIRGKVYRRYPDGPTFAPVVGYSQPKFGAAGIEAVANVHLNGGAPSDAANWRELGRQIVTRDKHPRGLDLTLTLDAELQRLAVKRLGGRRGAAVVLNPEDGAIRVLASAPSYDPNRIDADLFLHPDADAPLLNRATQGLYPPGSSFKIAIAALALERRFRGTLDCPAEGYRTSSGFRTIRDHEYYVARKNGSVWRGYGRIDMTKALAQSSNVFFAQLGVRQGSHAFNALAERIGLNRQIPVYTSPYGTFAIRTGEVPRVRKGDEFGLAQLGIGQGPLLVTPAYMAMLVGAVANGGLAMQPRIAARQPAKPFGRFMSASAADQVARMLRQVVTDGTAQGIDDPTLTIAGKTGTAQNAGGDAHSWFVGFAPAERPALAVAVLVEHGGYGATVAAPIARDLLRRARDLGLIR